MKISLLLFIYFISVNFIYAQWESFDLPETNGEKINSIAATDNFLFTATWGNNNGHLFRSSDNGISWSILTNNLPNINGFYSIVTNNNIVFALSSTGILFRSSNNGDNWTKINSFRFLQNSMCNPLYFYKDTLYTYVIDTVNSSAGKIIKSSNYGDTWQEVTNLTTWNITRIGKNNSTIFAAKVLSTGVSLSDDNGKTWTDCSLWSLENFTYSLFVKGTTVFAGGYEDYMGRPMIYRGLTFRSTDNGRNWKTTLTIRGNSFLDLGNILLVSGNDYGQGVYSTDNNGNSWTSVKANLPDSSTGLVLGKDNKYLFAGGACIVKGQWITKIWRRLLSDLTSIDDAINHINSDFSLEQNYPNPFNPVTTINYSLPKACFVTIDVFNSIGQKIKTIVNEEKGEGVYSVQFNGNLLTSGIYFCQMKTSNTILTKKMLLLK